ncbi:MAG: transcriptional repressor LexA [Patescibacteria group bacterium]|nr:transcriptional repressor LexA [Patescibacteria group bacterium]
MNKINELTDRQKEVLGAIYSSLKDSGYPPTLADLREKLKVVSNQTVLDLLKLLEEKGYIKKEDGAARGLKILKKGFESLGAKPILPIVGITAAGPYTEAFENLEWKSWAGTKMADDVFIVKIRGDSMIGAGYDNGDNVLVQEAKEFKNGDIVLARSNDGTTIKRLVHDNGKVYLKPENQKYKNIPIYPDTRLLGKIIGKVKEERGV